MGQTRLISMRYPVRLQEILANHLCHHDTLKIPSRGTLRYQGYAMYAAHANIRSKPGPPHHWFWGHLNVMGETMAQLPHDVHYQAAVTTIAQKYNLPGVFW
jgi:hypothetical protein